MSATPRILAAAQALCGIRAAAFGADAADMWAAASETFIEDARAALAAADAADRATPAPPPQDLAKAGLEARLATLRQALDPQWQYMDDHWRREKQRAIAARIQALENELRAQ